MGEYHSQVLISERYWPYFKISDHHGVAHFPQELVLCSVSWPIIICIRIKSFSPLFFGHCVKLSFISPKFERYRYLISMRCQRGSPGIGLGKKKYKKNWPLRFLKMSVDTALAAVDDICSG